MFSMKITDTDASYIHLALEVAIRSEGDLMNNFLEADLGEYDEEIEKCRQRLGVWERLKRRFKSRKEANQ